MLTLALAACLFAEDWPEWRGRGRAGVWNENGLIERFPESGLPVSWRTPVGGGYSGPAVANGRVFVTDYAEGVERALAFEEKSGKRLWEHAWPVNYRGLEYPGGPRATPTVDGDLVYVLGARGHLFALRAADGSVAWKKDYSADFQAEIPTWGSACAPLVYRELLIAVVGGRPDAKIVAFDKRTGRELWRALSGTDSETGYSQPLIAQGKLLVWHAGALAALHPETGKPLWEHPFRIHMNTPIATPVVDGPHVLITAFFQGARLLNLATGELLWRGNSDSEIRSETIHSAMVTPVIDGDFIYGICAYGQLRCLRRTTAERVWETQQVTVERARNATAFVVKNGSRHIFYNDRGELILALLSPAGYKEISRTRILNPTSPGGRRELGAVNWVHPAFANGHVVVRNDREMVRVSLKR